MTGKEKTRRSCNYDRAKTSSEGDAKIVSEYERGCKWAAFAFVAMWAAVMAMEVIKSWL